jgi:hypothetical protein
LELAGGLDRFERPLPVLTAGWGSDLPRVKTRGIFMIHGRLRTRRQTFVKVGVQPLAAGGLIGLGAPDAEQWRLVGTYTGRILKGDKPGHLPVQQSTRVDLTINMKAAKALRLTVPAAMLSRADKVIE